MNVNSIDGKCIGYFVIFIECWAYCYSRQVNCYCLSHYYFYFGIYILLFPFSCLHFSIFIGIIWRLHKHTRIYFVAQMHFRMWLSCIINSNIIYKYISSQKEVNKLSVILNEMARPRFHLWYLAAARASVFVVIFRYIFIMHLKHQYHLTKHIWKVIKFLLWNVTYKKHYTVSRS